MKEDLIPYLFSLPLSLFICGLTLMKTPPMTSLRQKLIGFGLTWLHFLPRFIPMIPFCFKGKEGNDFERKQT